MTRNAERKLTARETDGRNEIRYDFFLTRLKFSGRPFFFSHTCSGLNVYAEGV